MKNQELFLIKIKEKCYLTKLKYKGWCKYTMNLRDFLLNQLILIRPYSVINIAIISIITIVLSTGQLNLQDNKSLVAIIIALFYWICSMYFAEFLHKNIDNRKKLYSNKFAILIYLTFIAFCLIFSPTSLVIFLPVLLVVYLYAAKSKKNIFSHLLFLFRPAPEIGLIYAILTLYGVNLGIKEINYFIYIVYLISISRNLIGDVRDIKHDKYTLPKVIGKNKTYLISIIFLIIAGIITIKLNAFFALLPILLISTLITFKTNSYALHRIYITTTGVYFCFLLNTFINNSTLVTSLMFLNFMVYFTYNLVPREANENKPSWI